MPYVQVRGRFVTFNVQGEGAKTRLIGLFTDGTMAMEVVWFNRIKAIQAATGMRGVYPLTDVLRNRGISSRSFHTWIQTALNAHRDIQETLPPETIRANGLMPLGLALATIHNPSDNDSLQRARFRLKFEELFMIQVNMLRINRARRSQLAGFRFTRIAYYFNTFYTQCLPFELTGAQKRVLREIRADMNTGRQMNRLLQGDVGSGKTLVALMSMLIAIDNSTQACLMAPTEILATQHYETISQMAAKIGLNVRLLTGSTPKKERVDIHRSLADGSLHILIGTHAVLEDPVGFNSLGLVVIDEQHRFGVAQRARLWNKNTSTLPHVLVMTATPIPRTLAMTVYGDLDVSVIDELPPGRKPIMTLLRYDNQRLQVYQHLFKELSAGRQAYIVYPLIEENEKLDLISLEEGYEYVRQSFPNFRVAYVHGRMRPEEKDHQMYLFSTHQADILVATTVIEVGVNVPNATVMIIENAERFGLSQLHQLRGRVGRGGGQSYCILMTKHKIAKDTRQRLEIMTATTDGFVIAEADMKMRGPGDIEGTMQSGIPFDLHIANLATDGQIIQLARNSAEALLDADPDLNHPANSAFISEMRSTASRRIDWSRIS